jgi:orotate phosphoribosyltransferase
MTELSSKASAAITARILLEVGAVLFRPDQPFILTSGRASPVYVDCRRLIGFPRARRKIIDIAVARIEEEIGLESLDVIAGGETAGIPYAAWIAERLALPMAYVRKKPKGFGRNEQIEGDFREGWRALLVEDLATDGGSKVNFINAIRQAGGQAAHALVVFHYGIFPQSVTTLKDMGVALIGLATWWDVLDTALADGRLSEKDEIEVRAFLGDPEGWSKVHGGMRAT